MHIFRSQTLQPKTFFRHPSIGSPVCDRPITNSAHQPYGATGCHFSTHQTEWSRGSSLLTNQLPLLDSPSWVITWQSSAHQPYGAPGWHFSTHQAEQSRVSSLLTNHVEHLAATSRLTKLSDHVTASHPASNQKPLSDTYFPTTDLFQTFIFQPAKHLSDIQLEIINLFPTPRIKPPTAVRHPVPQCHQPLYDTQY